MSAQTREEANAGIESRFIVLFPDGKELTVSQDLLTSDELDKFPNLKALIAAEHQKNVQGKEPLSIQAMQKLELVDYEPASDRGHFRFYPKGALIFGLLHSWAEEIALNRLGAYAIETPIIYDWSQPDIRQQAESFHERHYRVHVPDESKEFILRFAGDFGLFRMMKDAQLTHRHLPVRLYEFAPSFRYEQGGELAGLRRLRGFWMPDIHSFCTDLEQGLSEYIELYYRYTDLANGTGVSYAVAFRVVADFYEEHKKEILEMIQYSGTPAYIELLSKMKHYWVMKHEINTIDGCNGVCQVSTVQLDIKDASTYGITYIDSDGQNKGCIIVHSSIGSPERWIYSILENSLKAEIPSLPLWLSPTQVRLISVSDQHVKFCQELANKIRSHLIRVDIDDRSHPVNWKIRAAGKEWVPYSIVCGDKEVQGELLNVRCRGKEQESLSIEALIEKIEMNTQGMPKKLLPGLLLSKRPVFRGRD